MVVVGLLGVVIKPRVLVVVESNVTYKVRWEYAYLSSCLVWLLLSLYKWG